MENEPYDGGRLTSLGREVTSPGREVLLKLSLARTVGRDVSLFLFRRWQMQHMTTMTMVAMTITIPPTATPTMRSFSTNDSLLQTRSVNHWLAKPGSTCSQPSVVARWNNDYTKMLNTLFNVAGSHLFVDRWHLLGSIVFILGLQNILLRNENKDWSKTAPYVSVKHNIKWILRSTRGQQWIKYQYASV